MAINKIDEDCFEVECDTCSGTENYDGSFMDTVENMKDDGWKISCIDDGDFEHTCPDCVEKEDEELDREI